MKKTKSKFKLIHKYLLSKNKCREILTQQMWMVYTEVFTETDAVLPGCSASVIFLFYSDLLIAIRF